MLDFDYSSRSFLISRLRNNVESFKYSEKEGVKLVVNGSHSLFNFKLDQNLMSLNLLPN